MIDKFFKNGLFDLILTESRLELRRIVFFSALAGLSGAFIIVLVNQGAGMVAENESPILEFFAFLFCVAFYSFFTKTINRENVISIQGMMYRFRLNIINLVLKSDLNLFNSVSKSEILAAISRDAQIVSQSVVILVSLIQSCTMLFFSLIYLAILSPVACAMTVIMGFIAFMFFSKNAKVAHAELRKSFDEENITFEYFGNLLNGFQELKMSSSKSKSFIEDLIFSAKKSRGLREHSLISISNHFVYVQIIFYLVVGMLVFVVPVLSSDFSSVVVKVATTSLFMVGSFQGVIQSLPSISQADISARQLLRLRSKLEDAWVAPPAATTNFANQIQNLSLENIAYHYADQEAFKGFNFGPANISFDAGKVYFIRGKNGSGKTTLVRVLLGLYEPSEGRILVDGIPIPQPTNSSYRDLFSVVFSDFYLFKKLYGLVQAKIDQAQELIVMLRLEDKVSVLNAEFDTVSLSTGQRKRLALMVALLEDRPFVVLDEWAADQDPEFRKYFYEKLIPYIKGLGKTVIAITHDDKYYDVADEVITVQQGKLI